MILDAKLNTDQYLSPQKKANLTIFLANLPLLLPTINEKMRLLGQEPIEKQIPDWVIGGGILLLIFGIPWAISALRDQSGYGALLKESQRVAKQQAKQSKTNLSTCEADCPYSRREFRQAASALQQAARKEIQAVEKRGFSLGAVEIYIASVGNSWPFAKDNVINLKARIENLYHFLLIS